MTLLVVLGFVVIATILAALYLSLRSARGGDRDSAFGADGAPARNRQARGGSRSGQASGLAGRLRAMTGRGGGSGARRDRDFGDAQARSRGRGGDFDRDDLVTAGTGPREMTRVAGSRSVGTRPSGDSRRGRDAGLRGDESDPAFPSGYGRGDAGYDGYDGAADTQLSGPGAGDSYGGAGRQGHGSGSSRGYGGQGGPSFTPNPAAPSFTPAPAAASFTPAPTGPSFTPDPASAANGTGAHGRGGRDRAGASRGERGNGRSGRGDRNRTDGFSGSDADATQVGYGPGDGGPSGGLSGDGFDADRFGSGPRGRRADAPRRGRRSESARGDGYPDSAGDFTGPNRGYGLDDHADPAMRTDSPFAPTPDPRPGANADEDGGEDHMGRRRIGGKLQRPHLRLHREKPDYDNDPWPSSEEESGGVSDEQFWADINTDKPLATTARTAQANSGPDQPGWADEFGPQGPAEPAERPAPSRGRRARRREEDQQSGTEPNPYQQMDTGPGQRRRGRDEPSRRSRGAEEDPLTSASFSRHAREASDSRSYRAARESRRGGSHGRPESTMADTQAMMPDTQRFSSTGPGPSAPDPLTDPLGSGPLPSGPRSSGGPGTGPRATRGIGPGGDLPPSGPRDRYGDGGYRNGARPADPYADRSGGYEQPGRGSRHASPGGRPPVPPSNGQRRGRPALPGPGPSGPPTSSGPMPPRPRPGAGPGTGGRRDGGDAGYRTQPNGPGGSNGTGPLGPGGQPGRPGGAPGYGGTGDSPYQPRSGGYPGDHPNGRRPGGRENGRRRPDDYDDPYGNTGNGRY